MPTDRSREELLTEIEDLARRLEETEQILAAIQSGEVDALVVSLPKGEQIFTLEGAEHPYRILVETMNEGAVTLAPDGAILYCNRCLADMLQVPQEKLVGSMLESYVAPADIPVFRARLEKCSATWGKEEISVVAEGGRNIPVLFSCSTVDLERMGTVVLISDISAVKQAERTILRLNRLYAVLSAINHAIVQTNDPGTLFREACRAAVELGGFRLAWVGLVEKESGLVKVAAAEGETGYLDGIQVSINETPDGTGPLGRSIREATYHLSNDFCSDETTAQWQGQAALYGMCAAASIAIKENDEAVGALTVYAEEKDFFDAQQVELLKQLGSDISFALDNIRQANARKEAEHALQKETMKRVLTLEELRRNEQLLIQQSRLAALGEMIGNIAHQWRQPLNNLALLVQQVPLLYKLKQLDEEGVNNNTSKAMEYIQHMSKTIDDFRNFFKPDKEKVLFKVYFEITKTLSLMEGTFKGHQIITEVQQLSDPEVEGYPNEFSQVMLNILMNARDALVEREVSDPKVKITISSENGLAVVTIEDNAGGISEEIIDKIFDPYFTTKGPQAGTGVGLFMSKTIIEKNMNGRLIVRNIPGGAEFRIEI